MSSIHSHGRDPESQREIERLKNEVERLSKENTRLSKENEEYQQEREALHDQIEEQKLELMHSRGTIDKMECDPVKAICRLRILRETLVELDDAICVLEIFGQESL